MRLVLSMYEVVTNIVVVKNGNPLGKIGYNHDIIYTYLYILYSYILNKHKSNNLCQNNKFPLIYNIIQVK